MKSLRSLALLLAASGCASPLWEARPSLPSGRLHVPRVFRPLRPGSIYPDRARPVPASGRPAVVLAGPAEALAPLGERGLVVLRVARPDLPSLRAAVAAVSARPEAGGPVGLLLADAPASLARDAVGSGLFAAAVLAGLEPSGEGAAVARPVLVLSRCGPSGPLAGFGARAARALGTAPAERWYRSDSGLPKDAWRDAAEWLALALGATGPVAGALLD